MALVDEQTVNTELLKVNDRILALGAVQLFELRLYCLAGFHKLLDRKLLPVGSLHLVYATLNIIELLL